MIPLSKLLRLPRSQRLRKAEKILALAELRLLALQQGPQPPAGEPAHPGVCRASFVKPQETADQAFFFSENPESAPDNRDFCATGSAKTHKCHRLLGDLLEALAGDGDLSPGERRILGQCRAALADPGTAPDTGALRRALNTARHILLAATGRYPADWDFTDIQGRLDPAKRRPFPGMAVYLEDIRSPFNVGAMFRSAESFGAEKIWLSPLCADPRHRRAERTAMGCVDVLPWERLAENPFPEDPAASPPGGIGGFPGSPLFAMETGGIPVGEFPFPESGLMIAGSEELGVSPAALAAVEASLGRVSIPTYGAKGSLNVSAAFAIIMQRWAEDRKARALRAQGG